MRDHTGMLITGRDTVRRSSVIWHISSRDVHSKYKHMVQIEEIQVRVIGVGYQLRGWRNERS